MKNRGVWVRRARKTALVAAIATAAFALVGFLVVPPIARRMAQNQLGALLGREVKIAKVRLNPFALSLTVEGFEIREADGAGVFLGFARLYVNAQLSSVFRRAPVIKEIRLESPRVRVVRTKATADAWADVAAAYNFSDIVARLAARPKSPEVPSDGNGEPPRFSLNNIRITGGAVTFEDRPLGERHEVSDLAIGVPFVSTLPVYLDSFVEPGLNVRIDGTPFAIAGRTKPFKDSLETVLELRLQALDLTRYLPFVPLPLRLGFTVDSARLTLALDVAFARPRADAPSLTIKGRVALEKIDLREKRPSSSSSTTPLLTLEKLAVVVGAADITKQNFRVDQILVSGLEVHARRSRDGTFNFQRLLPPPDRDTPPAAPKPSRTPTPVAAAAPRFALDRFTLEKAKVHYRDESVSPAFESEISDIAVSVRGLSNAPGATAKLSIGLRATPGGTVTQEGTLRLTPLAATGTIAVSGLEPHRLAAYYRDLIAFDVVSGRLRLGAAYSFEQGRGAPSIRASDAFVEVDELALRRPDARDDFVRLPALTIKGGQVDVGRRTLTIAAIDTHGGRVRAVRDAKGVVDLTTLVAPPPAPVPATPGSGGAQSAPAWTIGLGRLDLDKWAVRFEDRALPTRAVVTLDPIAVKITDFSTAPGARAGVDVRIGINKTGRFQIAGNAVLEPLAANVRFDLRDLELVPLQPYVQEHLNLTFTGGKVSLRGQTAIKRGAGPTPEVKATADLGVTELATVDREKNEPLVGWKSFQLNGIRFTSAPLVLSIAEVALTDLQARLVSTREGDINLAQALEAPGPKTAAKRPTPQTTPQTTTTPAARGGKDAGPKGANDPQISIAKVRLQGGHITFDDATVRPNFAAELSDFGGLVSGLSSSAGSSADVDLKALVNRTGALSITGKVNPLAKDLLLDVQMNLSDVELPPMTPYAGKYAGLTISKGKLGVALDYKIANRKLAATNKLLVDQLTFGDKVESKDATKLPVRLAVALLKDRRGLIDVTLPIEGSLDDPEFKVWRAVLKVLGNLMVKAATAPFSLIASAFGGGDELSRIDFPAGAAGLDAVGKQRVGTLAKVLQERPGISFELEGHADPKQDSDGLKRFLLERKVKAKKLAELLEAGTSVASVDDIAIDAAERERLVRKAYDAEPFPKPKNALGLQKELPAPDMEKMMLANTSVAADDLRALALRRATLVQAALAKATPGAAGRVFLIAPRVSNAGRHVELKLKND
ncbi:MAG: DUF748 domain-containing protein [Verrucomicrobiota bacterium]